MKHLRCAVPNATLTALDGAGQFFDSTCFETNVFPSLVQGFFDLVGHVDDGRCWNDIVPAMNESIKDLIEPEIVFSLAIVIEIADLAPVPNMAFASERSDGAEI